MSRRAHGTSCLAVPCTRDGSTDPSLRRRPPSGDVGRRAGAGACTPLHSGRRTRPSGTDGDREAEGSLRKRGAGTADGSETTRPWKAGGVRRNPWRAGVRRGRPHRCIWHADRLASSGATGSIEIALGRPSTRRPEHLRFVQADHETNTSDLFEVAGVFMRTLRQGVPGTGSEPPGWLPHRPNPLDLLLLGPLAQLASALV